MTATVFSLFNTDGSEEMAFSASASITSGALQFSITDSTTFLISPEAVRPGPIATTSISVISSAMCSEHEADRHPVPLSSSGSTIGSVILEAYTDVRLFGTPAYTRPAPTRSADMDARQPEPVMPVDPVTMRTLP